MKKQYIKPTSRTINIKTNILCGSQNHGNHPGVHDNGNHNGHHKGNENEPGYNWNN